MPYSTVKLTNVFHASAFIFFVLRSGLQVKYAFESHLTHNKPVLPFCKLLW